MKAPCKSNATEGMESDKNIDRTCNNKLGLWLRVCECFKSVGATIVERYLWSARAMIRLCAAWRIDVSIGE